MDFKLVKMDLNVHVKKPSVRRHKLSPCAQIKSLPSRSEKELCNALENLKVT